MRARRRPQRNHENREPRDLCQRVRVLRAPHHRQRCGRLGPDLDLQRRHHGNHLSPPGRALGPRGRRVRHRGAGRSHRGARAQVSRQLPLPRDRRARYRALGPARQARGQTGRRAARRHAAPPARLRLLDAAGHLARGRSRAARCGCATSTASMHSSGASQPSAATTSTNGPDGRRRSCRRWRAPWATAWPSWSMRTAASRRGVRSRSGGCSRPRASAITRSRARTGSSRKPSRSPTHSISTSPAASRTGTSPPGRA